MRKLVLALGAFSMVAPAALILPVEGANAKSKYEYREWRGRDGRVYCRKPDGTTGLVVGAVGGALVGRTIDRSGDRTMGTLLGAAAGGLLGREIERGSKRCK